MSEGILRDNPPVDPKAKPDAAAPEVKDPTQLWNEAARRFLAAVIDEQQEAVEPLLQLHYGHSGLRRWVDAITSQRALLPNKIPPAVIDVYLQDPEAAPLYECEECGLAVPVRPNRLLGPDAEPDKVYFPECPACGGQTGYYVYRTRDAVAKPPHSRPR